MPDSTIEPRYLIASAFKRASGIVARVTSDRHPAGRVSYREGTDRWTNHHHFLHLLFELHRGDAHRQIRVPWRRGRICHIRGEQSEPASAIAVGPAAPPRVYGHDGYEARGRAGSDIDTTDRRTMSLVVLIKKRRDSLRAAASFEGRDTGCALAVCGPASSRVPLFLDLVAPYEYSRPQFASRTRSMIEDRDARGRRNVRAIGNERVAGISQTSPWKK